VNAVRVSSLGLTLISVLAAVLTKRWLARFTHATPGLRSNNACERHLRYLISRVRGAIKMQWMIGTICRIFTANFLGTPLR
jgi:hypothetical protein